MQMSQKPILGSADCSSSSLPKRSKDLGRTDFSVFFLRSLGAGLLRGVVVMVEDEEEDDDEDDDADDVEELV